RMSKAHTRVQTGGLDAAISHYRGAPSPNLILVETSLGTAELLGSLQPLAELCDPSTRVVVIGHENDVSLYRDLIRAGVSEYMVAPIAMADLLGVISGIFTDPESKPLGKSLAFV